MKTVAPYRPSNGTEGECFYEAWCCKCSKDAHMSTGKDWDLCDDNEICPIIADTLAYDINDPKYPKAWVYKDGQPCCTEFVDVGTPAPRITEQERDAQLPLL